MTAAVYALMVVLGVAAFVHPFWLPATAVPRAAHAGDAPLVAAVVGLLVVVAVTLELRRRTITATTVAVLAVVAAAAGLLRLLDLPGGGSGIFFLVVLAGAGFGTRFGLLLGLSAMAVSAAVTGGIGPWLPFQMLALGWMGAGAGLLGTATARLGVRWQVLALAAYAWVWAFVYGAVMNLWFWPFAVGTGPLSWQPGLDLAETLRRYRSFYVVTSLGWDAAGALANAALVVATGVPLLRTFRRFARRLSPAVVLEPRAVVDAG